MTHFETIRSDRFAQYYFTTISNLFSRKVSSYVRQNFGIGLVEWRIISNLAREPDISAARISQNNVMDKGLVSRGFKSLQEKGLIELLDKGENGRNVPARLTAAGIEAHRGIYPFVQQQYAQLMDGLSEDEIDQLFETLKKLADNLMTD